jgi:hypothetical protein
MHKEGMALYNLISFNNSSLFIICMMHDKKSAMLNQAMKAQLLKNENTKATSRHVHPHLRISEITIFSHLGIIWRSAIKRPECLYPASSPPVEWELL